MIFYIKWIDDSIARSSRISMYDILHCIDECNLYRILFLLKFFSVLRLSFFTRKFYLLVCQCSLKSVMRGTLLKSATCFRSPVKDWFHCTDRDFSPRCCQFSDLQ